MANLKTRHPANRSSGKKKRDTSLKSVNNLRFRSAEVISLIKGRRKSGKATIIGLIGFGAACRTVYMAARGDNPYADFVLCAIEEKISLIRNFCERKNLELSAQLPISNFVEIGEVFTEEPYEFEAKFATPYANQVALLMIEVDALVCQIHNICHLGILPREQARQLIRSCCSKLRSLLSICGDWKLVPVTREDVKLDNERAKRAAKEFKFVVPEEIMSGELRGVFAPALFDENGTVTENVEDELEVVQI